MALRRVVAAIAGVGENAADLVADGLFHVRDDRCERVTVIGIAGQRFCMQGELAFERFSVVATDTFTPNS